MTQGHHDTCDVCGDIPARLKVDILNTAERLPAAVEALSVLGGAGQYGAEQLRKCPGCGAYFSFIHDHDSEAGLGEGWTDEVVARLSRDEGLALAREAAAGAQAAIRYWSSPERSDWDSAADWVAEARLELKRLETELEASPRV